MLEYMKWGESMEKNIQSKPQPKKGLKKRRIKEILFIVSMIVCLGIGFIFINPYRYAAEAAFYNEISGRAEVYYGRKTNR